MVDAHAPAGDDAVVTRVPGRRQEELDARNAAFWDELCGTAAARALGVTGSDRASLAAFDRFFFDLYPYLNRLVPFDQLHGKAVLEVGLGYGSVSQRLAECGARVTALDIARAPAAAVAHRWRQSGLSGRAVQGSILTAPFADGAFDHIVSIGCVHHTGNLERAVDEVARLLRPGGGATLMSYSATSYSRWLRAPRVTWAYVRAVNAGNPPPLDVDSIYDANVEGGPAPETVLLSKRHFARILDARFRSVRITRANVHSRLFRRAGLATIGPLCGLDLYAQVTK